MKRKFPILLSFIFCEITIQSQINFYHLKNFVGKCSIFSIFSILFLIHSSELSAQNKLFFSAGISNKWNYDDRPLENEGEDNVMSLGGLGYFATLGIKISKDDDPDFMTLTRITFEKFDSELQAWDQTPIGSVNAKIFRIDPFACHGRIKESKFLYSFSPAGFSIFTGKSTLLPNSFCYNDGEWYLIEQMDVKSSVGWSLLTVGMGYQISQHIQIGFETVMIEEDRIKVILQTSQKEINSDVNSMYSFLPLKLKFTINL